MLFPQSCGCETPGSTLRRSISRNGSVFREVFENVFCSTESYRYSPPSHADEIDDNPLDLNAFGKHGGTRIKVQNAGRRS